MRTFPLVNVFKADYQFPSHLDLRGNGLNVKRQTPGKCAISIGLVFIMLSQPNLNKSRDHSLIEKLVKTGNDTFLAQYIQSDLK